MPAPENYFALANQIARAAHDLSVMEARLVYLAMAQLRPDDSDFLTIEMSVGDIVRALGLSDRGFNYKEIRAVRRGVMKKVIELDTDYGDNWFGWFSQTQYIKDRDVLRVRFNDELKPYILEVKKQFQIHTIADLSKLRGRYSMGLYVLVMSYKGQAGKSGNKPGEWYVDLQFDYLREHFKIADHQYKAKKDLRVYVVDNPIREINEADLGLRIDCDYDKWRRGRRLDGVRLLCKLIVRDEPRPVHPATAAEKEAFGLRAKYPEDWDRLLDEEMQQPSLPFVSPDMHRLAAEGRADARLAAAHQGKKPAKKKPVS